MAARAGLGTIGIMFLAGLKLNSPFVAAPMAGVTSLPFRLSLKTGGAPLVYTEMISTAGLLRNQPQTLRLLGSDEREAPWAIQLFGGDPGAMEQAARVARQRFNAAFIDINMGCPVKKVRRIGAGSALLDKPEVARQIIEAASQGFGGPVTVKIRLGYSSNTLDKILPHLLAACPAAITLHARTVAQGYSGQADWQAISWLKRQCAGTTVLGNGDVQSAKDAIAMLESTGCDGVMIGRGSLADPYIFARAQALLEGREFTGLKAGAMRELLHDQANLALKLQGEKMAIHLVRQFIMWRVRGLPGVSALRYQAGQSKSLSELLALADDFFSREEEICG